MIKKICVIIVLMITIMVQPVKGITEDKVEHIINGVTYSSENSDLENLKPLIKDVEILGLGESTHGTKEFGEMRNKLFEFLVREMDYSAIVLESPMGETELINKYINGTYEEEERKLIDLLYPTHRSEENLNLIKWAKEYNKNAEEKDKIRIYGMDTQDGEDAIKNFDMYFEKIKSPSYEKIRTVYGDNTVFYGQVKDDLIKNKDDYITQSSEKEYDLVVKLVENKINSFSHRESGNSIRNVRMSDSVDWIKGHEEKYYGSKRIMVYSQQSYIQKNSDFAFLGGRLKEKYGGKYYSMTQVFYSGTFAAVLPTEYHIYEIKESSKNNIASKIKNEYGDEKIIYFDINEVKTNDKLWKIFSEPSSFHDYGVGSLSSSDIELGEVAISDYFDGVIYYENTTDSIFIDRDKSNVNVKELKKTIFSDIDFSALVVVGIVIFLLNNYDKRRDLTRDEMLKQGVGITIRIVLVYIVLVNLYGVYSIISNYSLMPYSSSEMVILISSFTCIILGGVMILFKSWYGFILMVVGNVISILVEFSPSLVIYTLTNVMFIGFLIYRRAPVFKLEGLIERFKHKKDNEHPYKE